MRRVGRYTLHHPLAKGGMGAVYLASLRGEASDFSRVVAAKVLHPQFAEDPEFRGMFLDEARIVSCIRHANVASTLDVLDDGGQLVLVMDYVDGLPLSALLRRASERGESVPLAVVLGIAADVLEGLHAAHEATSPRGEPLGIVHRDVSPQNVLVGFDGVARVIDFGVAKAAGRSQETQPGEVKGKAGYMAPEQATGKALDRRADVYAASVVLWELLVGARLFAGQTYAEAILKHLTVAPEPPSARRSGVPPELDAIVLRGLAKVADERFPSARAMADALSKLGGRATQVEIAAWVDALAHDLRRERAALLRRVQEAAGSSLAVETPASGRHAVAVETIAVDEATAAVPRARGRGLTVAIAATLGLGVAAAAFVTASRKPSPPRDASAVPSAPSAEVPPSVVASVSASAPKLDETPPARATAAPHPAAPAPKPRASMPASPPSAPPPTAPARLPNCCSPTGLRLRFGDCVDNCTP